MEDVTINELVLTNKTEFNTMKMLVFMDLMQFKLIFKIIIILSSACVFKIRNHTQMKMVHFEYRKIQKNDIKIEIKNVFSITIKQNE